MAAATSAVAVAAFVLPPIKTGSRLRSPESDSITLGCGAGMVFETTGATKRYPRRGSVST